MILREAAPEEETHSLDFFLATAVFKSQSTTLAILVVSATFYVSNSNRILRGGLRQSSGGPNLNLNSS
jgi:hypothetical protein